LTVIGDQINRQTSQKTHTMIDDAKSIIVTDASYKTTWFRDIIALGWDFAG
jgi:hypothetical protein